jgi:AraC-like DNA-binding protein
MAKARELLIDPLLTVQQVADRVGYEDPSNFVRAFRSAFGLTPHAYSQKVQLAAYSREKKA